ncbi:hypothetical protein SNEBB_008745 [Seison nebaliae]|nr:hypothetical protein SNEBB_008745 [Seison nebaliae]
MEENENDTELGQINTQINEVQDESLESTRRMLQLCEDSKEAGIRTLVMLDEQGDQLDHINVNMDQINTDMRDAEKNLEGLEKCCGLCVLPWKKRKNFDKDPEFAAAFNQNEDGKLGGDQPRRIVGDQQGFITRVTNDDREDEMEKNVTDVNSMIGNLRNMAVDMSTEIDSQNSIIKQINVKANANEARITEANKRANVLLKK